ncbi:hypothetical protein G6F68_017982 [Rhizopus microsporus]|nr:hypothetical protein G6F68_017982 [Rhizopus microsporus]
MGEIDAHRAVGSGCIGVQVAAGRIAAAATGAVGEDQEQRLPGGTDRFQTPVAAIALELDRARIGHLCGQAGDVDDRQRLARRRNRGVPAHRRA